MLLSRVIIERSTCGHYSRELSQDRQDDVKKTEERILGIQTEEYVEQGQDESLALFVTGGSGSTLESCPDLAWHCTGAALIFLSLKLLKVLALQLH